MKLIAELPGAYKIDLHTHDADADADVLVITFNDIWGSFDTSAFGLQYLRKRGINVITCLQAKGTMYQSLSAEEFARLLSPYVEGKKVFLYGHSLGAYAAIYYAGAVNGSVLSVAPIVSIHPLLLGSKASQRRLAKFSGQVAKYRHLPLSKLEFTRKPVFILYDPQLKEDSLMVDQVIKKELPDADLRIVPIKFAGHDSMMSHLRATGKMDDIMHHFLHQPDDLLDVLATLPETDYTRYNRSRYYYRKAKLEFSKIESIDVHRPKFQKRFKALAALFGAAGPSR